MKTLDTLIETKMQAAGVVAPAIHGFLNAVHKIQSGDTGLLPESSVEPIPTLPRLDNLSDIPPRAGFLQELAVIKLNGGLGTGMGLDRAKSLLVVKGSDTFLDFIARQILHLRQDKSRPAFYLMNSFSTQADTLAYLSKYPKLTGGGKLDFLQNKVPKLNPDTLEPVSWPIEPELEWCPPGHGDIYPAMLGSGLIEELLGQGVKYLFVSNSDNLGATVDLKLGNYFAESGYSFLMEVAERTASDRKGGHLTRRRSNGRLVLRESVQCPKEDENAFQDIKLHRFFNTNNLWIHLEHLRDELDRLGGSLPLPLIKNLKTVDPQKPDSPKVLQLETAMGAAIECFPQTGAVVVPRTRFSPVKTTADLLALRSDAYQLTADHRLVLAEARKGKPPLIELDGKHYKLMPDFDVLIPTPPSLLECELLKVAGRLKFAPGIVCKGQVEFISRSGETKEITPGTYCNMKKEL